MEGVYSLLPDRELRRQQMMTQRPFEELNLWQRILAEHWADFAAGYEREQSRPTRGIPERGCTAFSRIS